MKNTIRTFAVVGALAAGWLGMVGWVASELSTVKQSVEAVVTYQPASPSQQLAQR